MQKIAIHSVPRSGSTWLGEILNSSANVKYCFQPLFSYKFNDFLNELSTKEEIDNFFSLLKNTDDSFICQTSQRSAGTLPYFKKSYFSTHIIYKEVRYHHILENLLSEDHEVKLILLVRNPIEVMNSWLNASKEFDRNWNAVDELLNAELKNQGKKENFYGLNAWIEITKLFERLTRCHEGRIMLITYATLQYNLIQAVEDIYEFCNLQLTDQTFTFLKESTERQVLDTYSVFRGGKQSEVTLDNLLVDRIEKTVVDAGLSYYLNF